MCRNPFELKPGAAFGLYRIKTNKFLSEGIEEGKTYLGYQYCAYLVCIDGNLFYCKNRKYPVWKEHKETIEVEEIYLFRIKTVKNEKEIYDQKRLDCSVFPGSAGD